MRSVLLTNSALSCLLMLGLGTGVASAAGNPLETSRPTPPGPPRWTDDYRFLDDPAKRTDPFDTLRYQRLSDTAWMQLGGEFRYRADYLDRPGYGLKGLNRDDYLQQRLMLHADVHLFDDRVRSFVQLANTRTWGKDTLAPVDESRTEVSQAFMDFNLDFAPGSRLTTRIGRQELGFGDLVFTGYREAPNVRQSFDGVRLSLRRPGGYTFDAFAVKGVHNDPDSFDDGTDNALRFYGLYSTLPTGTPLWIDVYAFDVERDDRSLDGLFGDEKRYTWGTRLFGKYGAWDWSWNLMYQTGHLADADIDAWAISGTSGYGFTGPLRSRLGIRLDVISGDDRRGDDKVGTFDPLFPRNSLWGKANLTTPANLVLFGPTYSFSPRPWLQIEPSISSLWRQNNHDAVYYPNLIAAPGTTTSSGSHIGMMYKTDVRWNASRNLTFDLEYLYFDSGAALRDAGGRDSQFVSVQGVFRF